MSRAARALAPENAAQNVADIVERAAHAASAGAATPEMEPAKK
jgi:hypothetical protein